MEKMKWIWSGVAADDHWDLYVLGFYDGPAMLPECCASEDSVEALVGPRVIVWRMLFLSRNGARCKAWWQPLDRLLQASLPAWSSASIAALKRHLASLGEFPRAALPARAHASP